LPKKHGFSHAFAAIITFITAGLLLHLLKIYFPLFIKYFNKIGILLHQLVLDTFNIDLSPDFLSIAVFASFLAFIWGVAFSYLHSD